MKYSFRQNNTPFDDSQFEKSTTKIDTRKSGIFFIRGDSRERDFHVCLLFNLRMTRRLTSSSIRDSFVFGGATGRASPIVRWIGVTMMSLHRTRARSTLTDDADEGLPARRVVREIDDDAHRKRGRGHKGGESNRFVSGRIVSLQFNNFRVKPTDDVVSVRTRKAGDCRKRAGKGSYSVLVGARVWVHLFRA